MTDIIFLKGDATSPQAQGVKIIASSSSLFVVCQSWFGLHNLTIALQMLSQNLSDEGVNAHRATPPNTRKMGFQVELLHNVRIQSD
jgi:hypothetical protein